VEEYRSLLSVARAAARKAADFIAATPRPKDPAEWHKKGRSDFVTFVDREAEAILSEELLSQGPEAVIQGEELSPDGIGEEGGLVWVVDPLDGTTNFLHDYPAYAVSVAGVIDGIPRVGVVVDISRDVVYTAMEGGGAKVDDATLAVSRITEPSAALLGTGYPFKHPDLMDLYMEQFRILLKNSSGVRRAGAAALDLAHVAEGRLDGFWELSLAPWDVAAGTLLIREAGGIVTDETGSESVIRHGAIVAGNPAIHAWLSTTLGQI